MMTFPSVLGYIAGTKNGKDAVKVFFDPDVEELDEKSEEKFTGISKQKSNEKLEEKSKKKSKDTVEEILREKILEKFENNTVFKENPSLAFVNVKNVLEERFEKLKEKGKQNPVAPPIPGYERDKIHKIIQSEGERIIATYSNVTGLGVDRKLLENGQFGESCIVLYCFDKTLVPFGEDKLPTRLKGCSVDIRLDFIMFGLCNSGCNPLKKGCSIGIPEIKKAGSVGFFVRSTISSSENGFLTAAHVALSEKNMELSNKGSLEGIHEIIHPSLQDSERNSVVGTVSRSVCKNIGPEETGVDAAFVKFQKPTSGGTVFLG